MALFGRSRNNKFERTCILTSSSEFDPLINERKLTASLENVLAVTFHLGLLMFVLGKIWQLFGEQPVVTDRENLLKLIIVCLGFGLAGAAWITGLQVSNGLRAILFGLTFAFVTYYAVTTYEELNYTGRALIPARVENGKWIHDGLGLSFTMLPDWQQTVSRPTIIASEYSPIGRERRVRLCPNELAVFSHLEHRNDQTNPVSAVSSIRVEALRRRFSDLSRVVATAQQLQAGAERLPGFKLIHKVEFYRLHGFDVAEFRYVNQNLPSISRFLLARSGEFLLQIIMEATREEDFNQFQGFLDSIQITHRPTSFSE